VERCGVLHPAFIHPYPCLKFSAFPVSSFIQSVFLRSVLWGFGFAPTFLEISFWVVILRCVERFCFVMIRTGF